MDRAPSDNEAVTPLAPAVEAALVQNQRRFLAFLERRLGSRAQAEELLQGAFVRALEHGAPTHDEEGAVRWFYRVLTNALIDHQRRSGAESRALAREANEAPAAVDAELHATVCACMHGLLPTLKPDYAEVLQRVDLDERPVLQVAEELGITANNASVRLHRARAALKQQLQRSCGACAAHGCLDCSCQKQQKSQDGHPPKR